MQGISMSIFISYSSNDKEIVHKIAQQLIINKIHIWIDEYELNIGDSLLDKIQSAINEASALIVVLSQSSIKSAWCQKELNSGLMRELQANNKLFVLPLLIEECDVPPFLQEKIYADFRKDFDTGLHKLIKSISRFSHPHQQTFYKGNELFDWAVDWGENSNKLFFIRHTIIHSFTNFNFKFLVEIKIDCNKEETARSLGMIEQGITRECIFFPTLALNFYFCNHESRLLIENQMPLEYKLKINDTNSNKEWKIIISIRKVGEDNGYDQLIDMKNYIEEILNYIKRFNS